MSGKRVADIVVSTIALVVLSLLLVLVAGVVVLSMGRPVFFRQSRPGKDEKLFEIYKFRTMRLGPGSDENRLTKVGEFLRKTTLDELPQFVNVLRGDMSLVGPRPLPAVYLQRYSTEQARRHEVRPGITGLAQVRGRNSLTWPQKFEMDIFYIDNQSWKLDLQIMFETVLSVAKRSGISAPGQATMPEFLVVAEEETVSAA